MDFEVSFSKVKERKKERKKVTALLEGMGNMSL
jgi:hypothetical protein